MATIKDLLSNMISKIHTKMDAPTVTEADNGKVLGVVDGDVGLVEQESGLPSDPGTYKYMATDGDGNWVPVDRLAWKAEEKVTIVPEQTFAYASSGVDLENYDSAELTTACVVVFDGVVYHCEPSTLTTMAMKMYRFGNLNKIAGSWTDSGEPFALEFGEYLAGYGEGWMAPKVYTGDSVEHTIFVYTLSETTHPIPAEYLPAGIGGDFVVNFTFNDDYSSFTVDKTIAEIKEAFKAGQNIFGKNGATLYTSTCYFDEGLPKELSFYSAIGHNLVKESGNVTGFNGMLFDGFWYNETEGWQYASGRASLTPESYTAGPSA